MQRPGLRRVCDFRRRTRRDAVSLLEAYAASAVFGPPLIGPAGSPRPPISARWASFPTTSTRPCTYAATLETTCQPAVRGRATSDPRRAAQRNIAMAAYDSASRVEQALCAWSGRPDRPRNLNTAFQSLGPIDTRVACDVQHQPGPSTGYPLPCARSGRTARCRPTCWYRPAGSELICLLVSPVHPVTSGMFLAQQDAVPAIPRDAVHFTQRAGRPKNVHAPAAVHRSGGSVKLSILMPVL